MQASNVGLMKKKTSITSSSDVLAKVDHVAGFNHSRSAVIEHILRLHFRRRSRREWYTHVLEQIDAAAIRLNSEADDVLTYQTLGE